MTGKENVFQFGHGADALLDLLFQEFGTGRVERPIESKGCNMFTLPEVMKLSVPEGAIRM
jgi:hypothetical protein